MSPELGTLIEKARTHLMTPEERRQQRISFVWGMLPMDDLRTKDDVRRHMEEMGL